MYFLSFTRKQHLTLELEHVDISHNVDTKVHWDNLFMYRLYTHLVPLMIYQKALQMYKTLHGGAPEYLSTPFTFTSEIHSRILRSTCPLQLYCTNVLFSIQECQFGTTCLFMYNIHPQLMSLKQGTLSGCKIRAYLSNSVFFRYVLMFSSTIVHYNTVYIYCVRMYVNRSINIIFCLSCSVSCSVLLLMRTLW